LYLLGDYSILFYLLRETVQTITTVQNEAIKKEVRKTSPLKNIIALAFCFWKRHKATFWPEKTFGVFKNITFAK